MASNSPHHISDRAYVEEKNDGKEKIIWARGFNIVWGRDNRYWHLPSPQAEHKYEPAELVQVSWLEVTGTVALLPGKSYEVQFEVTMKQDAFGWNGCPVFMMAKLGKKGRYSWKKIGPLDQVTKEVRLWIPEEKFPVSVAGPEKELYFGLYEVWSGKWKGGLHIHRAVITEVSTSMLQN